MSISIKSSNNFSKRQKYNTSCSNDFTIEYVTLTELAAVALVSGGAVAARDPIRAHCAGAVQTAFFRRLAGTDALRVIG